MPEKDPMSYTLLTYGWVMFIAIWGGLANYVRKIRCGLAKLSLTEVIGEMCISAFVGIITFFMCESAHISPVLSAALIGISGHMGSRSMMMIEKMVEAIITRWVGRND